MLRKTDLGDGKMKVDVEETDYCSSAVIVEERGAAKLTDPDSKRETVRNHA